MYSSELKEDMDLLKQKRANQKRKKEMELFILREME
jgi:hypothetical protein